MKENESYHMSQTQRDKYVTHSPIHTHTHTHTHRNCGVVNENALPWAHIFEYLVLSEWLMGRIRNVTVGWALRFQ